MTATAEPGFTFLNWTDNGTVVSTNSSYTLAMDVNHSLVANFAPAQHHQHQRAASGGRHDDR